ncbi:MAG: glyoxalase/bleomycin resistance protein/dioxygenase [Crocinitomicaceae bacterium]|jgi:predicted enzyme related to lactoylglutathione lyase|nr:glyoxalase/bleomycin resistance protein/dioxygenase [Crocinitomicaceae bacterium]
MDGQIIGLGGIFIKFRDPKKMNSWYKEVLGLTTNDYGVLFGYNHQAAEKKTAFLQLGTFEENTKYFGSDSQQVMLNFRVKNVEAFLEQLKAKDVKIVDEIESYDYGKFVHIEDPEGNRIEFWEPVDSEFESSEPFHVMD